MAGKGIALVQTGGTIDKDYPRKTGGFAFEIDEPAFERILENVRPQFPYEVFSFLKKDSLEISDDDRADLRAFILELEQDMVVITHGTDTLIETALALTGLADKVIALTGSKLPERFRDSDASFNLGVAIGAVSTQSPGVYVCMNGQVIPAEKAKRDSKEGIFYLGKD